MKAILFTNVGADLYGADYVLLSLVRSLDAHEYRSVVVLPYDGPLVAELERAGAHVRVRELPVLRRRVFRVFGLLKFGIQFIEALFYLLSLARKEKIDIIHTNTASIWPSSVAAWILRKPHVWQVMEIVEKPKVVAWAMGKVTGIFSTKVFCISNAVRDHFLKFNPGRGAKFETLYHGVDLVEYDPSRYDGSAMREKLGVPQAARVVLYAGRFSAWKGQDVFAKAIQILHKSGDDVGLDLHFVILGSCFPGQESFEHELDAYLDTIGADGRIHRAGFQRNLPQWMAACDIFVLPSKRPEPNATALIGAMAMGLACVGTNKGGTVETILSEETGLLIPPDDPLALAAALRRIASDPRRMAEMGREGKKRAASVFSLSNYCRRVREAYEQ